MVQPLAGIRVLDVSRVLAGPYCSMLLGDLGAEVLKIEQPGIGDDTRAWGPPFADGESAYYLAINRNKRSVALDLKAAEGRDLFRRLAACCDVVLENFRPGTMERLGLGYEVLQQVNPRLVYAAISGFGPDGPMRDRPGYDLIIQGYGGIMSITGQPDGEPTKVGVAIVDITAGLFLASGILAALLLRERTGRGQRVDTSLLEAQVGWLINWGMHYLVSGEVPGRWGNAHPNIAPYQTVRTKDGHIILGVGNDSLWRDFCQVTGLEALTEDPRFLTNARRVEHREPLMAVIQERFAQETSAHWLAALTTAGVPCGPVHTIDQVFADAQVRHRQMLVEIPHPSIGRLRMAGIPLKFSETPASIRRHPPLLGEHTDEVLRELLGATPAELARLRAQGVTGGPPSEESHGHGL
ncbi:MAG: CoA transferase [Deltaproteobacteria bacterium]|nr:CoA transferase [Deltaproteobacteria bacterium]